MLTEEYWEPPQAVTLKTILSDFDRSTDKRVIRTGKRVDGKTLSQADACILIERVVKRIIRFKQSPYFVKYDASGVARIHERPAGKILRSAVSTLGLLGTQYDYSEHVALFLNACWTISSIYGLDLKPLSRAGYELDVQHAEMMNEISLKVKSDANDEWFKRAPMDRRWETRCKLDAIAKYTAQVLRSYTKTTIVRLDLSYLADTKSKVTIDDVFAHLGELLRRKDYDKIFEHLVGYAWAMEQGVSKGFHIHVAFMYKGSRVNADIARGFRIADLWEEITGGLGYTYVCNAHPERYDADKLGIGVIKRADTKPCVNAINAMTYLTKDYQYLRMKPSGRRTFGTGVAQDVKYKLGHPSVKEPTWPCSG